MSVLAIAQQLGICLQAASVSDLHMPALAASASSSTATEAAPPVRSCNALPERTHRGVGLTEFSVWHKGMLTTC